MFSLLLPLFSKDKNGCVASFGLQGTVVSCVEGGVSVASSAVFAPGGGAKASEFLQSSLNLKPSPLVEEIKSKLCFVSPIAIESFRKVWNAEGGRPVSLQVCFFVSLTSF